MLFPFDTSFAIVFSLSTHTLCSILFHRCQLPGSPDKHVCDGASNRVSFYVRSDRCTAFHSPRCTQFAARCLVPLPAPCLSA